MVGDCGELEMGLQSSGDHSARRFRSLSSREGRARSFAHLSSSAVSDFG
jgi:hypothetical protein